MKSSMSGRTVRKYAAGSLAWQRRFGGFAIVLAMAATASFQMRPAAGGAQADAHLGGAIGRVLDRVDVHIGGITVVERAALRTLYQPVHALWLDPSGNPTTEMEDALTVLRSADTDGLQPVDYFVEPLGVLMARIDTRSASTDDLARADVTLSAGMLRYLRDLHVGRVEPQTLGFRLERSPDQPDLVARLRAAIAEGRAARLADDLRPALAQYRLLQGALVRYRALAADSASTAPKATSGVVHPGDAYDGRAALEAELRLFGDWSGAEASITGDAKYEGAIVDAVKRFQDRHGLEPDGILGPATMAALRVPLAWRVRQIELALERLRWLPRVGEKRLIALNIPMFRLWAWDIGSAGGPPAVALDAIVGRALTRQTPVLVADMDEVIFRPYWNVPRSILQREILPKLQSDRDYLRREGMEIVKGQGDAAAVVPVTADALVRLRSGQLRVRQRPGPTNALGLIKFGFPNREDVYIHGTPGRSLFLRSRRDFSHGCVRVADPVALATWALQGQPEWTRERIVEATTGAETRRVSLSAPVQVILFYTTAAVMPEDDTVRFAKDIYGHDEKLDRALTDVSRGRERVWQLSRPRV